MYGFCPRSERLSSGQNQSGFNLTKRQLICFGGGVLVGLPLFFLLRERLPGSGAVLSMIAVMLPFFLLGMYEKNGQPLEKVLHHYIQSRFVRPKRRPYKTDNLYAAITRQIQYEQEVSRIVQKKHRKG